MNYTELINAEYVFEYANILKPGANTKKFISKYLSGDIDSNDLTEILYLMAINKYIEYYLIDNAKKVAKGIEFETLNRYDLKEELFTKENKHKILMDQFLKNHRSGESEIKENIEYNLTFLEALKLNDIEFLINEYNKVNNNKVKNQKAVMLKPTSKVIETKKVKNNLYVPIDLLESDKDD